jgi:hypothetical protein
MKTNFIRIRLPGRAGLISRFLRMLMPADGAGKRTTLRLDGTWDIAEGSMDAIPRAFDRRVPVPGLADLAEPAFLDVGVKSDRRQAFWYRTRFSLKGPVPPTALLKVHKARYGTKVYLNGRVVGESLPNFTPSYHDVREGLKPDGQPNELIIRVGAFRDANPPSVASGWDFELTRYVPGIYDSVDLILTGSTRVDNIQTVPDVAGRSVRVVAELRNGGRCAATVTPTFAIRERASGKQVAATSGQQVTLAAGREQDRRGHAGPARLPALDPGIAVPVRSLRRPRATTSWSCVSGCAPSASTPGPATRCSTASPISCEGTNLSLYRFMEDPNVGTYPGASPGSARSPGTARP